MNAAPFNYQFSRLYQIMLLQPQEGSENSPNVPMSELPCHEATRILASSAM